MLIFFYFYSERTDSINKKVTVKIFIMFQNNNISSKSCCFELSIYQINLLLPVGTKTCF